MNRRSRFHSDSSLELLLDTMCNAFGGVIFIAMLLAVVAQFAEIKGPADSHQNPVAARRLKHDHMALQSEIRRLKAARTQQTVIASVFDRHPNRHLLEELLALRKRNAKSSKELEAVSGSLGRVAEHLKKAVEEKMELEQELRGLETRIQQAKQTVEGIRKQNMRELRLPKLHPSSKQPFWMIAKWNRLYILKLPDAYGTTGEVNTDEVRYEKYPGFEEFEAIRGRGIDLHARWQHSEHIRSILRHIPGKLYGLHFAVYPDSYRSFIPLRDFFVEKGYDYNWAIMEDPNKLRLVKVLSVDVQ